MDAAFEASRNSPHSEPVVLLSEVLTYERLKGYALERLSVDLEPGDKLPDFDSMSCTDKLRLLEAGFSRHLRTLTLEKLEAHFSRGEYQFLDDHHAGAIEQAVSEIGMNIFGHEYVAPALGISKASWASNDVADDAIDLASLKKRDAELSVTIELDAGELRVLVDGTVADPEIFLENSFTSNGGLRLITETFQSLRPTHGQIVYGCSLSDLFERSAV